MIQSEIGNSIASTIDILAVQIKSGQSLSDQIDLGGLRMFRVNMPAAWTAAVVTFSVSDDGGTTWKNLRDISGNEIIVQTAYSDSYCVDPVLMASVKLLKIRSGTSAAPVNQAADRTIGLVARCV